MQSLILGLSLVLIFMVFYYKVFGVIANIAVALNIVLISAIMSILSATLTLPGIAGIVLTIGMAVDANVLIFSRIKEELKNRLKPLDAINAGYDRAYITIVDANLTTLIVALILYTIGTGPVQGFAITLSVGILTSMFTAILVTRFLVWLIYDFFILCLVLETRRIGGLYLAKPYSAKPYSAVQESAKPYSAKPYSAKPYSAKPTSGI